MSEVSVNIRGRDDGLGQQLDNLRQKASALGVEVANLNKLSSQTPTEQKISVNRAGEETLRQQQSNIRRDYQEIRRSQYSDYQETSEKYAAGKMSKKDFDKYDAEFQLNQKDTNNSEKKELLDSEREMARLLRVIAKEMVDKRKLETERAQADNKEFSTEQQGTIGRLISERKELRSQKNSATSDEEIEELNRKLAENKKEIASHNSGGDGKGGRVNVGQMASAAGNVGSGDLVGTGMAAPEMMRGAGMSGGAVAGVAGAAAVLYALWSFIAGGDELTEAMAPSAALRGNNLRAGGQNKLYKDTMDSDGMLGNLGLTGEQFAQSMYQKAMSTGSTDNLREKTLQGIAFQKGFGADVGGLDQFERFNVGQKESTKIAMDVLNVLTSIDKSSLKEGSLVTLTEKLSSQQAIMSVQRQRRDMSDSDSSLRILAAFESIGLSKKGEKGADFLTNTLQGLGEGGSDNVMMLKFEAAKRARPDLANNPAALRRLVKFNADSPEYMNEAFKMMGQMSGSDQIAEDDLLYTFFNPQSEEDMNMYKKAMKSGDFSNILKGKGLDQMKQRKSSLSETAMMQDAQSGVGATTQMINDFKQMIKESSPSELFKSLIFGSGSDSLRVTVVDDKTKTSPKNSQVHKNKTTEKR